MRTLATIAVLVTAFAATAADPSPELKKWNGVWKPVSVMFDGSERMPNSADRDLITLIVQGNEYRLYTLSDAEKQEYLRLCTATLTLDPETKTFKVVIKEGQGKAADKARNGHGIYDLSDGKLKLCYGPAEKPRPTKFEAPPGSGFFNETWVPGKLPEKR